MSIIYNDTTINTVKYNNTELDKVIYNGVIVYQRGIDVVYHSETNNSKTIKVPIGESVPLDSSNAASKSGWTFIGWRKDTTANGSVESSITMGDEPINLYAVYRQSISVTYYNNSTSASSTSKDRLYNNGNIVNPSFTLSQASRSGWTARGWSTSTSANGSITYNNNTSFTRDSNVTLYGMYQKTVTLSYSGNGATGGSTASQSGTAYYNSNGSTSNPSFTLRSNGFSRTNYKFVNWRMGSTGGAAYNPGASVTLGGNTTFYASWQQTSFPSNGTIRIGDLKFTSTSLPGGNTYVQISPTFSGFGGGFTVSGNTLRANNAMNVYVSITATSENYYQGESVVTGMEATTGIIQIRKNGSSIWSGQYPNDGRSNNSYHNPKTTTRTGSFNVNSGDVLTFYAATTWGTNYWYSEGVCTLSSISGTIKGSV